MNKKLKELYEKKIELISYDLEKLGFGILTLLLILRLSTHAST